MCVCVSVSVCGGQRSLRGICCAADAEKPLALSDTHGGSVSNTLTCLFSCRGQRSHHRAGWVAHSRAGDLQLHERVRERKTGRLEKRNVSVWMGKSLHGRFRSALKLHRGITISCQVQQAKTNVLALWCGTDSTLNSVRSLTVQYLS